MRLEDTGMMKELLAGFVNGKLEDSAGQKAVKHSKQTKLTDKLKALQEKQMEF